MCSSRRHQLSHSGPFISCLAPGCGVKFHRQDVADRHANTHHKSRASSETLSTRFATRQPSPVAPPSQFLGNGDNDEFEVFYHYTTTFDSLYIHRDSCAKDLFNGRQWWLTTLPRISAVDEAVKTLALSIASAHLSCLRPDSNMCYKSSSYLRKAAGIHRKRVAQLDREMPKKPQDIDALCLMSYLLCIRTRMTLLDPQQPTDYEQHFSNILLWLSISQGHAALSAIAGGLSQETDYWRLVVKANQKGSSTIVDYQRHRRTNVGLTYLTYLFEGADKETRGRPRDLDAYRVTLHLIDWAYHFFLAGGTEFEKFSIVIAMAFMIPPSFTTLLRQKQPRALAIFAHFLCLQLDPVFGDTWWIASNAHIRVQALAALVPQEWNWAVEWPLAVVHGLADIESFTAYRHNSELEHGYSFSSYASELDSSNYDSTESNDYIHDRHSTAGGILDKWYLPIPSLYEAAQPGISDTMQTETSTTMHQETSNTTQHLALRNKKVKARQPSPAIDPTLLAASPLPQASLFDPRMKPGGPAPVIDPAPLATDNPALPIFPDAHLLTPRAVLRSQCRSPQPTSSSAGHRPSLSVFTDLNPRRLYTI